MVTNYSSEYHEHVLNIYVYICILIVFFLNSCDAIIKVFSW